jgi:transposase
MRVYVVRKWPLRGRSRFLLEYHTGKSVVTVQRAFRAKYAKDPPTDKTIRAWHKQFTETGCLCKQKSSGRPLTAEYDVERVRASFLHSLKKSKGTAVKELSMSKTTVWRVLHKSLVFKQQCGGFCIRVWCLNNTASKWYNNCRKWPTTDAVAPEVPWHYALWFFSLGGYVKDQVFVHHCHVTSLT